MDEKGNIAENGSANGTDEAAAKAVPETESAPQAEPVKDSATDQPTAETAAATEAAAPAHPAAPVPGTAVETPEPGQQPGAPAPAGAPVNTMQPAPSATPALVCGILAIVFCFIPIVGIVLGIVAIVLAGKYFKAGGTLGQGTAGRICGIIGIVLSVIMMIFSAITMFTALQLIDDYSASTNRTPAIQSSAASSSASAAADFSGEEGALEETVSAKLQLIKDQDAATMAEISAAVAKSFSSAFTSMGLDLTLQDCGVDPEVFTAHMVDGFDFEPYYMDIDASGTEGEANYKITVRDITEVLDLLNDKLDTAMGDGSINSMGYEQVKAEIGTMIMESVNEASITSGNIWDVDAELIGGVWVIDQEDWDDEIDYFFGFM